MKNFLIVVSGCGRCGTTLLMQMLHAGGIKVIGNSVSYEDPRTEPLNRKADTTFMQLGKAIKIIDLHRKQLPDNIPCRILYLTRNNVDQAKSQIKLLQQVCNVPVPNKEYKAFSKQINIDNAKAFEKMAKKGYKYLPLSFGQLIEDSYHTCVSITKFLQIDLDIQKMIAVVIKRPLECMPDMSIEIDKIKNIYPDNYKEINNILTEV